MHRDVALWFILAGIFAAFCGVVSHLDVVHSWVTLLFWVLLHHQVRRTLARPRRLAFTRYCHYQYGSVHGIQKVGRGGFVYCAIDVQ